MNEKLLHFGRTALGCAIGIALWIGIILLVISAYHKWVQ